MYLQLLVQDLALERVESFEERHAVGQDQMGQCHGLAIGDAAEDSITDITMPDLFAVDLWNIEGLGAVGSN